MLNTVNYRPAASPARHTLRAAAACLTVVLHAAGGVGCAIDPPQGSTYGQPLAEPPDASQLTPTVKSNPRGGTTGGNADEGVCPPSKGNDQGVGVRCTKGGGQCDNFNAQFCSADYTTLPIHFCTTICDADTNCGEGAICAPEPSKGKFWACLPPSCVIVQPTHAPPSRNACLPTPPPKSGVGTPCTPNGGQCRNLTAGLCTIDALPTSPFSLCTFLCKTDADCGDPDDKCFAAPGGLNMSICMPKSCLP